MEQKWSGILLITPEGDLITMHRDTISTIRDSGCYGIFGGATEGNETPLETAIREITEETNLRPQVTDFEFFKTYYQQRDGMTTPATLHIFILRDINPNTLKIYEGQGIKILNDASSPHIAKDVRGVFEEWFDSNSKELDIDNSI